MRQRLTDRAFDPLQDDIARLIDAAWEAYANSRKSPHTRKAGAGYADPDYDLSLDWIATQDAIQAAQKRHDDTAAIKRVLLINGSPRTEHTCPSETSKTYRLCKIAEPILTEMGFAVDFLDLSRLVSEMGKEHPPL